MELDTEREDHAVTVRRHFSEVRDLQEEIANLKEFMRHDDAAMVQLEGRLEKEDGDLEAAMVRQGLDRCLVSRPAACVCIEGVEVGRVPLLPWRRP